MANLTATEELIQKLKSNKKPSDKSNLLKALSMFASPEAQKQIQSALPEEQALSKDEQRLAAASKLEQALLSAQAMKEDKAVQREYKVRKQDVSRYTKLDSQMRAAGRGSKFMRDIKTARQKGNQALEKIEDMLAGRQKMNDQNLKDLSSQISAMLTGGVPSQTLIDQTSYSGLKMKLRSWQQFLLDTPMDAANPKILNEILAGVKAQMRVNQGLYSDEVRLLYNNNRDLFTKPGNEDLKEQLLNGIASEGIEVEENERGFLVDPVSGAEVKERRSEPVEKVNTDRIQQIRQSKTRDELLEMVKIRGLVK